MSVVDEIKKSIGKDKVITGEGIKERYPHIWHMDEPLVTSAILLPTSTEDISHICRICNDHKQQLVVHGGLTNLVGSTFTNINEIVISLEKLNSIVEVDEISRTMTVEAGVILEHIQNVASEGDMLFPLNFGAKGTAQIGGCISSNAGGMRVIKYGMTRDQILGLEGVLADGTIVSSMKKLIKDNSGYDIKQLFIGAEGTLAIITKAVLRLREKPISRNCAFIAFNDFNKVVSFLKYADSALGGNLSVFEIMWEETYKALTSLPSTSRPPLPYGSKYYVLIESLGGDTQKDKLQFDLVLEEALNNDLILDAAVSNSSNDNNWFFNIREDVGVLLHGEHIDQHFDISLPINVIEKYVEETLAKLRATKKVYRSYAFGHLGDGNIHFIVLKESDDDELKNKINEIVYKPLQSLSGSVSAEHGIGLDKKRYLHISRSQAEINLMKTIKKALDPNNILNPSRIFDIENN